MITKGFNCHNFISDLTKKLVFSLVFWKTGRGGEVVAGGHNQRFDCCI